MATVMKKDLAHKIIDNLPDGATWDDLMHQLYVREAVERGYADSVAGKTVSVQKVRSS